MVVSDLFSQQCKPWQAISQNLVELIHEAAAITFNKILSDICDANTKTRLMKGMIQPSLYHLRKDLKDTVAELLQPHLSIHPITYNEYLTEAVKNIQGDRHKRKFDRASFRSCGWDTETVGVGERSIELSSLLQSLLATTAPDPKKYAASLAADVAAAYYKASIFQTDSCVLRLTSFCLGRAEQIR